MTRSVAIPPHSSTQASYLLRIHSSLQMCHIVRRAHCPQENGLKLVHASIGEEKGWIIVGYHGGRGHCRQPKQLAIHFPKHPQNTLMNLFQPLPNMPTSIAPWSEQFGIVLPKKVTPPCKQTYLACGPSPQRTPKRFSSRPERSISSEHQPFF